MPGAARVRLAWLLILGLAMMWGTSFASMSQALISMDPLAIMGWRLAIGAVVLVAVAIFMRVGWPLRQAWWQYLGIAAIGNCLPFGLIAWGQLEVSSAVAGAIMGTMPMVTAAMAMGLGLDRLRGLQWVGLGIGFLGLLLLARGQAQFEGSLWGVGAIVIAVLCYAASTMIAKRGPDQNALRAGAATLVLAGTIGLVSWGLFGSPIPELVDPAWVYVLYLAAFPTALAMVFYFWVVRIAGPVFLSQVNYMVPVVAFVVGMVFMDEALFVELPVAIGLILAGLYFASRRSSDPSIN